MTICGDSLDAWLGACPDQRSRLENCGAVGRWNAKHVMVAPQPAFYKWVKSFGIACVN